jgi:hypothetical protein
MKTIFFIISFLLSSIFVYAEEANKQTKSSTEIEVVQSRNYKKPYKEVFKATLSVLQDNKYEIKFTDINTGVISAEGDVLASSNRNQVANTEMAVQTAGSVASSVIPYAGYLSFFGSKAIGQTAKDERINYFVSSNIEELEGKRGTLVRLVITAKISGMQGQNAYTRTEDLTDHPEIYQDLFAKIDKKLFVRENIR